MKAPQIRLDYVLICDDIRLEVGNKPSAMGIFTDGIVALQFPVPFPKLCFLIHGHVLNDARDVVITAVFRYPKLPEMVLADKTAVKMSKAPGGFTLNLMISPLILTEPGEAELVLDFGTGRKFRTKFLVQQATQAQAQALGSPVRIPIQPSKTS